MSSPRFGRWQKATALVPLALLSAAWTASVAGAGSSVANPMSDYAPTEPDDSLSVPTEAIEAPASLSDNKFAREMSPDDMDTSVAGIPTAALSAYRRAETVINSADAACNLQWQLVAAIGRVESNHGRYGGNVLNDDGQATPGIYGIPLNGTNATRAIADTDGGKYDDDQVWDRAVGPMQFIPSTWSVVAVDADGDGERNPQDIDDAALASAVYLCSGNEDLGTETGREAAVYRYNNSNAYVDLVLSIHDAYLTGDYTSIPNYTGASVPLVPSSSGYGDYSFQSMPGWSGGGFGGFGNPGDDHGPNYTPEGAHNQGGGSTSGNSNGGGGNSGGDNGTTDPAPPAPPEDDPDEGPLAPVLPDGDDGGGGDSDGPVKQLEDTVNETTNTVEDTVKGVTGGGSGGNDSTNGGGSGGDDGNVVTDTISKTTAATKCATKTGGPLDNPLTTSVNEAKLYDECMAGYGY